MDRLRELWVNYRYHLLIAGAVLLLVVFAGGRTLYHRVQSPGQPLQEASSSSMVAPSASTDQPSRVCVDVKGAVIHPGIYYFKRGARVAEALKAAGGPTQQAAMKEVNQAKELADQQVVYVPAIGEQVPTSDAGASSNTTTDSGKTPINLNTASKEQLCQITGVGDKKADLIIEYRQQHGQFKTVDDLMQVSGFGEKTVAKIKDQVSV